MCADGPFSNRIMTLRGMCKNENCRSVSWPECLADGRNSWGQTYPWLEQGFGRKWIFCFTVCVKRALRVNFSYDVWKLLLLLCTASRRLVVCPVVEFSEGFSSFSLPVLGYWSFFSFYLKKQLSSIPVRPLGRLVESRRTFGWLWISKELAGASDPEVKEVASGSYIPGSTGPSNTEGCVSLVSSRKIWTFVSISRRELSFEREVLTSLVFAPFFLVLFYFFSKFFFFFL